MIRIEIETTVASGNYTANAYQEGEPHIIATSASAARLTALSGCLTALAANVTGDLTLHPIAIVTPRVANTV